MSSPETGSASAETEMRNTLKIDGEMKIMRADLEKRDWTELLDSLTSELPRAMDEDGLDSANTQKIDELKILIEEIERAFNEDRETISKHDPSQIQEAINKIKEKLG